MGKPENLEIPPSLDIYGEKKTIIPAEVKGKYRRRRDITQMILVIVFLLLPWVEINGHQALLLNLVKREFSFFGLKLYAYDTPLLFYILTVIAFGIVFLTAVWGRVWCGWACPQTVFIDGLFRKIEILTEGKYLRRRQLLSAPMTFEIFCRKTLKWFLFFLTSSIIAHSFIAVFVGSHELLKMISLDPHDHWTYFVTISFITGIILFDFGWFREQFCLIMCPYGRFQSVLMDGYSMAVTYDIARGEPRKSPALTANEKRGDCVSCRRCVEVCPTGIDIRNGIQMECIACTACMDACDEVMTKVKKPTGLIRYANAMGGSWKLSRPRALIYLAVIFLCFFLLGKNIATRNDLDVTVLRGKDSLFQTMTTADGSSVLSNHFRVHFKNQTSQTLRIHMRAMFEQSPLTLSTPQNPFSLEEGQDLEIHLFIQFPENILQKGTATALLLFTDDRSPDHALTQKVHLIGPIR